MMFFIFDAPHRLCEFNSCCYFCWECCIIAQITSINNLFLGIDMLEIQSKLTLVPWTSNLSTFIWLYRCRPGCYSMLKRLHDCKLYKTCHSLVPASNILLSVSFADTAIKSTILDIYFLLFCHPNPAPHVLELLQSYNQDRLSAISYVKWYYNICICNLAI